MKHVLIRMVFWFMGFPRVPFTNAFCFIRYISCLDFQKKAMEEQDLILQSTCFHLDYLDIMHSIFLVTEVNNQDYINMMHLYLQSETETYDFEQILNLPLFVVWCNKCPDCMTFFSKVRIKWCVEIWKQILSLGGGMKIKTFSFRDRKCWMILRLKKTWIYLSEANFKIQTESRYRHSIGPF